MTTESGIIDETDAYIDLTVGVIAIQDVAGRWLLEEDLRVDGEVWRVNKYDADPFPSSPHAHCIGGPKRRVGLKLHLGTRELFDGRKPTGRYLAQPQFDRLIELIQPKFPGVTFPL